MQFLNRELKQKYKEAIKLLLEAKQMIKKTMTELAAFRVAMFKSKIINDSQYANSIAQWVQIYEHKVYFIINSEFIVFNYKQLKKH